MKLLFPLVLIITSLNLHAADENDYTWVDQLNFDKKSEAKYDASKDMADVEKVTAKDEEQALLSESLMGLSHAKLEEMDSKTTDSLLKINLKCHDEKFEEGLKIADQIYSEYKNNTSYWNQLGTCYFLKRDYSKAILFYNKSRDLDPKFVPPVNNIGVVYQVQKRYQKALVAFKKAADLNTFSITPVYNLAQLYLKFGMITKAEPIFKGLLSKANKDISVNAALATISLLKGDSAGAVAIYSALDKLTYKNPSVGLNYAVALKMSGKAAEAQSVFSQLDKISAENKDYANNVEKFISR